MKKIALFLLLVSVLIYAHEVKEENPLVEFLFPLWEFHDAFHWIIALFFFGTCYHFRYVASRPSGHPPFCGAEEDQSHREENILKKLHRYFFWFMLIFIFIHASEIIFKWTGEIEYSFVLGKPYIYPFTSENLIPSGPLVQTIGNAAEFLYVAIILMFLFSCHYVRHVLKKSTCYGCYRAQTGFNDWHGVLFGASVLISVLLLLLGGHL